MPTPFHPQTGGRRSLNYQLGTRPTPDGGVFLQLLDDRGNRDGSLIRELRPPAIGSIEPNRPHQFSWTEGAGSGTEADFLRQPPTVVYRCETKHPQRRLPHCSVWRFGTKHLRSTYEEGHYPAIFSDKKRSIDEAVGLADGLVLAKTVNGSTEEPKRQRG